MTRTSYSYLRPSKSYPHYNQWFTSYSYPQGDPLALGGGYNHDFMFTPPKNNQKQPHMDQYAPQS